MIQRTLAWFIRPTTLRFVVKLGSVWVVSFVAASGGIFARRAHGDTVEARRRSFVERQRAWNGTKSRGR